MKAPALLQAALSGEAAFARALLDPDLPVPAGLVTWNGSDPARRFAVYRNNVAVSLVDALAARFPVVQALTGEGFFRAMARVHAMESPPRSRLMACFGDDFADFIARFPPADSVPYLADVARLEAARTTAFHAADAPALDAAAFAALDPATLADLSVRLHPSVQIVTSAFAVFSLWAAHQGDRDIGDVDPFLPEDALVARPALEVQVTRLGPGEAVWFRALATGACLGDATDLAGADPLFDPTAALLRLITTGAAMESPACHGDPA